VSENTIALKDILSPEIIEKLKAQSEELRLAEEKNKEEKRKKAEEARKAEQKRLENNFEYLLASSSLDWRNFK
jgi:hypothetical protein